MRAIWAVLACVVAVGCAESSEPADAVVGAWERSDARCTYAFLFASDGRYESVVTCDDGDRRAESGMYEARAGRVYARPDGTCRVQDWDAPYDVRDGMLTLGGLPFAMIDDAGPFSESTGCD